MPSRVTILFLDGRGAVYRREGRAVLEVLAEGARATGVLTVDELGRQYTYDLGTCLPLEGGDSVLARSSAASLARAHALASRQLALPLE